MHLTNATPFPALLHREAISGNRIAGAAVLRATFDIGTPCHASHEQPWRVSKSAWDSPQGRMEPDASFDRDGCDLLLFGDAATADGSATDLLDVSIEVGDFTASVRVFGDRTWLRDGDRLVPSKPTPFTTMPLSLERAFGGVTVFDELKVAHSDNPKGRGFYVEEEEVEGKPLPNIEDPEHLVARWGDRPDPVGVGLCPSTFGPRVRRGAVVREGLVVGVRAGIHNVAFPRFICPQVQSGSTVVVRGMGRELRFDLPVDPILATTRVGDVEHRDPLRIDQLGIEPALRRFFLTYRYTCVFPVRRGERRSCRLDWSPSTDAALPEGSATGAAA